GYNICMLSVALAVFNEEASLEKCLESVRSLADEIVIVDGGSSDNTLKIAESFKAKIIKTTNPQMFHINKQKALDAAKGDWVLLLDADERVSPALAKQILDATKEYPIEILDQKKQQLFIRHQKQIQMGHGQVGA